MDSAPKTIGEAGRLNKGCVCVTLDRDALAAAFDREVGAGFTQGLERSHPLLFANVSVFVPESVLARMTRVVAAVEASARLLAIVKWPWAEHRRWRAATTARLAH